MNYMLCQTLRLPPIRHELCMPPIPSVLLHTSLCLFSLEESLYALHPARMSCTKAHVSPCTHQRVSFIPEHVNKDIGVILAQFLGFDCNWNLCYAERLDYPTGFGAVVEHRSIFLAFLEGTESNSTSEGPWKKL